MRPAMNEIEFANKTILPPAEKKAALPWVIGNFMTCTNMIIDVYHTIACHQRIKTELFSFAKTDKHEFSRLSYIANVLCGHVAYSYSQIDNVSLLVLLVANKWK